VRVEEEDILDLAANLN